MSTQYQLVSPNIDRLVNLCVLCCLASLLIIGKGHNLAGIFLLLPALFLVYPIKKTELPKAFWTLSSLFCIFVLVSIISFFLKGGSASDIDQPSRFILAILVMTMLIKYPPKFRWIAVGIVLSSIFSFIVAIIHTQYYGMDRAFTGINAIAWMKGYMPIQDGGISMTIGLLSGCISIYLLKTKHYRFACLSFIGFICGVTASLMSGSRGSWIALPIIFLYLTYSNRDFFKHKLVITLSVLLVSGLIFTAIQSDRVMGRIYNASQDIQKLEDGNPNSSVGVRITLWKSALLATNEYPIFGSGYPQRIEIRKEQVRSGALPKLFNRWNKVHAHNQYLEYLSVYGIIGLISLLSIFIYPLYLFKKQRSISEEQRVLKECGVIHILSTMCYCLTQAFFAHNSGAIFYPLILSIFLIASSAIKINKVQYN